MSPRTLDAIVRLLVVQEKESDRQAIQRVLSAAGVAATIDDRADPFTVVELARGDAFDCIIIDDPETALPGASAIEVIQSLRAAEIWTPVMCIAACDEETGTAIVAAGAADFVAHRDLAPSLLARRLRCVLRLARAEREVRHDRRALEVMLSIVSHDLRSPLSAISVALDGLRDETLTEPMRLRYVTTVQRAIERADRLIHDLTTTRQLETGRFRLDQRPVAVRSLFERTLRENDLFIAQAKIPFSIEIDEGVDQVVVDADRIVQALGHLIGNGLRHARDSRTIELVASPADGEMVMLGVRDHGPGIKGDARAELFGRYWDRRERRAGSGLGLAIVRGIARAHGGDAQLEASPGGGALFMMTLPAAPSH